MKPALFLLQSSPMEDALIQLSSEAAKLTGGAVLAIIVITILVIAILRFLTMWWFGVTTVIDRLERLENTLKSSK